MEGKADPVQLLGGEIPIHALAQGAELLCGEGRLADIERSALGGGDQEEVKAQRRGHAGRGRQLHQAALQLLEMAAQQPRHRLLFLAVFLEGVQVDGAVGALLANQLAASAVEGEVVPEGDLPLLVPLQALEEFPPVPPEAEGAEGRLVCVRRLEGLPEILLEFPHLVQVLLVDVLEDEEIFLELLEGLGTLRHCLGQRSHGKERAEKEDKKQRHGGEGGILYRYLLFSAFTVVAEGPVAGGGRGGHGAAAFRPGCVVEAGF